ncbi:MAG: GlsB/YeaQ/YmgE family stress response membrane protein [Granulosicoccus sp.]
MPFANIVLMMLIGVIFGVLASVFLRNSRSVLLINILLGMVGAALGAFLPVIIGQTTEVDVANSAYLVRGLMGAFFLVVLASLFRPVKPHGM